MKIILENPEDINRVTENQDVLKKIFSEGGQDSKENDKPEDIQKQKRTTDETFEKICKH